jgi:hypothetical protein
VLEITVGDYPVAEAYDYGGNGFIDRIFLARVPEYYYRR